MTKTILILTANPKKTDQLDIMKEFYTIQQARDQVSNRKQHYIELRPMVNPSNLSQLLLDIKPHIVHFSGHGTGEEGIVFEQENGEPHLLDAETLSHIFDNLSHWVECVLLNACYSEKQAEAIAQHINYTIGMKSAILDQAAIAFSKGFYTGYFQPDLTIENCFDVGCDALHVNLPDYRTQQEKHSNERKFIHVPQRKSEDEIPFLSSTAILKKKATPIAINPVRKDGNLAQNNRYVKSFFGHSDWIRSLTFSPDSKLLISSSDDKTVRVWDIVTGQLKHLLVGHNHLENSNSQDNPNRVKAIGISPNGQTLITGSANSQIKLWKMDLLTRPLISEASVTRSSSSSPLTLVNRLPISLDNQRFAVGQSSGKIKLWNVENGDWQQSFQGHSSCVNALAFSSDSQFLVSGSQQKTIKIWQMKDSITKPIAFNDNAHLREILSLSIHDNYLVSSSADHTIKIWDYLNNIKKPLKILDRHSARVWCIAIHPDGTKFASASADYTIKLWTFPSGELINTLTDHIGEVRTIAFSPDGRWLASAGDDLEIKLWEM